MNPRLAPERIEQRGRPVDCGVAAAPIAGEPESGDHYLVKSCAGSVLIAVADGIGHGVEAARAARVAIATIANAMPREPLDLAVLVQRCHHALRSTRGAVMCLARFDARARTLSWFGVGNITGALLRARSQAPPQPLLVRAGVMGYRLPAIQPSVLKVNPGDLLVVTTDGIRCEFAQELGGDFFSTARPARIAEWILSRHAKGTDDGLALAARYTGP